MRRAVRPALIVVGLATAAYGTAGLTGGWFGTPPRREQVKRIPQAQHDEEPIPKEPIVEEPIPNDALLGYPGELGNLPPGQGAWCGTPGDLDEPIRPPRPLLEPPPMDGLRTPPSPAPLPAWPEEPPPESDGGALRRPDVPHSEGASEAPIARREWIPCAFVALGLGLAALAAWPRRRRSDPTH